MSVYLVTGGAGFIGSNLIDVLLEKNNNVICVDNFDPFYSQDIKISNINKHLKNPNFLLAKGDIRDTKFISQVFNSNKIECVIHLAAKAGVRPSLDNPGEYSDVNINGTINILESMKNNNIKNLIFASSSSVYGNNKYPFSETDIVDYQISPYAMTKKAGELICYTYHHLYNMNISCLRFFTAYGPRQRPEMAINKFSQNIIDGEPVTIFGDGLTKRDYTYIDDITDGIIKAIKNLNGFEIYNFGNSNSIAIKDLITILEEKIGKRANIISLPEQAGDVENTCADITKAKQKIGFEPKVSINKGVSIFIDWKLGKYEKRA
jgi:UDP-glucuronate 4-epimerase